jgi:hypothetical protein
VEELLTLRDPDRLAALPDDLRALLSIHGMAKANAGANVEVAWELIQILSEASMQAYVYRLGRAVRESEGRRCSHCGQSVHGFNEHLEVAPRWTCEAVST